MLKYNNNNDQKASCSSLSVEVAMVTTKILFCFTDSLILLHKIPQGLLLSLCLSLSPYNTPVLYTYDYFSFK